MADADHPGAVSGGPLFDGLVRAVAFVGGAVLSGLVLLVGAEVFWRAALNSSLNVVEELTGYAVVLLTFFGAALALRRNTLFRVEFMVNVIPDPILRKLMAVFVCASIIASGLLGWRSVSLIQSSFERSRFAPTVLETPLWIPQLLLPTGFALLAIFLAEKLVVLYRNPGETI